MIEGRHPVLECLKAGKPINKIIIAKKIGRNPIIYEIIQLAKEKHIKIEYADRIVLHRLCEGRNHQGVIAFFSEAEYVEVDDLLSIAKAKNEQPFLILLDGIEDPHNLGAIIRTADAAGAHGVVIPKFRAAGLTATVSKVSAGAVAHVKVARISNMNDCIKKLKEQRVWVVGLDGEAEMEITKADFKLPIALVIGGEGKGLSRMVRENCEILVKIPMRGKINSLNASVAAAVVMYEVVRQRAN